MPSTGLETAGEKVSAIESISAVPGQWTRQQPDAFVRGCSSQEVLDRLGTVKKEVTPAISKSHGLRLSGLELVAPGSISITGSGEVRRSACAERYRRDDCARLDTSA